MRSGFLFVLVLAACAEVDSPSPKMVLPSDYRTAFVPVRPCGPVNEHGLISVVVRVRNEQSSVYDNGPYPYPEGSLIVKEEYRDDQCTDLSGYTAMRKEAPGYFPAGGDWQWFRLDPYGVILQDGKQPACSQCHSSPKCASKMKDFTCLHEM
jgi:hypothetical protein